MGAIAQLKRRIIEDLLKDESFIMVIVDVTFDGLLLPKSLLETREPVGLNIGYDMAIPIPDLVIDDEGIKGTLSFSRTPSYCVIPWGAIAQLSHDNEHLVWVLPHASRYQKISDSKSKDENSDSSDGEEKKDDQKPSHLRLV